MLAHCFVLPHLYLNGLFTEREGDIENRTKVGEEEDGSVQCYLTQKKKMKLKMGRELLRRKRRKRFVSSVIIFFSWQEVWSILIVASPGNFSKVFKIYLR